MKSVALYGFATTTREGIWNTKADEIWSIAWAYKYNVPRIDRILEIHPIWLQANSQKPEYQKARDHWEWLKNNTTIPIYMLIQHPEVPKSIRFPIERVQEFLPLSRRNSVFTSSFDFLMALAILEKFERIELYGFEMGSDTEYRYQREGASYWIALADSKGIEVVIPENSVLLKKKMYGYQGGSMIYRQDLERLKEVRERQKKDSFAKLAYYEGQMSMIVKEKGNDSEEAKEIANKWDEQYRISLVTAGALQEIEYLLKEIDLEEPTLELQDPMSFIKL